MSIFYIEGYQIEIDDIMMHIEQDKLDEYKTIQQLINDDA